MRGRTDDRDQPMMAVSRWWQYAIGAAFGTTTVFYLPATAIMIAIVLGLILAWASLNSDGDDVMTALGAGYLTGVLGWGLFRVTATLIGVPL
jgi:hypothetical protein